MILSRTSIFAAAGVVLGLSGWLIVETLSLLTAPVDLSVFERRSQVVIDEQGGLLRAYLTVDGRWRLHTTVPDVSDAYVKMLVAYEDRRFYSHSGVDALALGRALYQLVRFGRPVSGASTLTMQVARLLSPLPKSMKGKLRQMVVAYRLERKLSKKEILELYLTLAPFGGNVEGVSSAAQIYFGKEPSKLDLAEAALLVAIPQSPEARRPDRAPMSARLARDRVLRRMVNLGIVEHGAARVAARANVPSMRRAVSNLAPHLADRLRRLHPSDEVIRSTIDGGLQRATMQIVESTLENLGAEVNVAVLVVANRTRSVKVYVGGGDYLSTERAGQVDLVEAVRSPGSTLKPFIYGMAFERLIVHPDTIVTDEPFAFGDYEPRNFNGGHVGDLTVRSSLTRSLNTTAAMLLAEVGVHGFMTRLRKVGAPLATDEPDGRAGLAVGLGGGGIALSGLARLYSGLANGGQVADLLFEPAAIAGRVTELLARDAAWAVTDILGDVPSPPSFARRLSRDGGRRIAFKTGTSYGFRDAWAVGFDEDHTVAVWIGRPDGAPHVGSYGISSAAPVMFRVFDLLSVPAADVAAARPAVSALLGGVVLPERLRRFGVGGGMPGKAPLRIIFPKDGARLAVEMKNKTPLLLSAQGGMAPYRWFVDGIEVDGRPHSEPSRWHPAGAGQIELVVVDHSGKSARCSFWLE